jgi:hypothetical protein
VETVIAIVRAHQTAIMLTLAWLFSAAMSTMPPLSSKAGFWGTWLYKLLQAIAANFNKHDNPTGIAGQTRPQEPIPPASTTLDVTKQ